MTAALWIVARGDAIAKVVEEDDERGTTTTRPPAADLAAQLHVRGGPAGRASRPSCPGRRTARAAIGTLAGGGHRGLPGPRPARFGADSGA